MGDLSIGEASGYGAAIDTNGNPKVLPTVTDERPAEGAINGVIATQTEMGVDPQGSLATVKARLSVEHDGDGVKAITNYYGFVFFKENVISVPHEVMYNSSILTTAVTMPFAGTTTAVGIALSGAGESFSVRIYKNGIDTGNPVSISNPNTVKAGAYSKAFIVGDYLEIFIARSGGAIGTTDVSVYLLVSATS